MRYPKLKVLDTSSPNKFFESLAAGVPVIQTTGGWMKDFLDRYNIGFTVDPDNPVELADLLLRLSDNYDMLLSMGQKAKEIASKEFNKDILADKMINAIMGNV